MTFWSLYHSAANAAQHPRTKHRKKVFMAVMFEADLELGLFLLLLKRNAFVENSRVRPPVDTWGHFWQLERWTGAAFVPRVPRHLTESHLAALGCIYEKEILWRGRIAQWIAFSHKVARVRFSAFPKIYFLRKFNLSMLPRLIDSSTA